MSNIDQQFIEFVVKSLVGNPDAVSVDRRVDEKGVLLELTVDPEDLGRVIGKRGATAQSLRTLLRALGTKNDARYNLKIIDNGVNGPSYSRDSDSRQSAPQTDSSDDSSQTPSVPVSDVTVDTPADEPDEDDEVISAPEVPEQQEAKSEPEKPNDRLAQTRQELADLDDLDV
jgi:predicted RNA-binding protein YlqC (UPF0109 family)